MKAALFTLRCFEAPEAEFPFFVTSFIVYGIPELIIRTADRLFKEHVKACKKTCGRVHYAGPLLVNSIIKSASSMMEVDWDQLAQRLNEQERFRLRDEGRCVFLSREARAIEKVEATADLSDVMQKEIRDLFASPVSEPSQGPKFLFIGSHYESDVAARVGNVFIIEASSLEEATAICSAVIGVPREGCLHVEWCCPIHKAN
jgi:hypothetical protein